MQQFAFLLILCFGFQINAEMPVAKCVNGKYPPAEANKVPLYVINLDLPPEQRWTKLSTDKKDELTKLVDMIKTTITQLLGEKIVQFVDYSFPLLLKTLPEPYASEIRGIANATGIPVGEITLYNVFYELFTVCTSIVAKTVNGDLLHARNLDFGLFLGWDIKNHTWSITEALRPTVVELDFQRNGTTVFRGVNFAGYVGILTGMKPSLFSLTIDERFQENGGFMGILEWILGDHSMSWLGFIMRDVFENSNSYEEAQKTLVETELLAPAYFILAGNQSNQSCVITKDRKKATADVWTMEKSGLDWFLVETNYDHWKNPPFFDDRRTTAISCLRVKTQSNATFSGIFDVLSSQPNLNKLTAYTALMDVKNNQLETYLQYCDDPCFPF